MLILFVFNSRPEELSRNFLRVECSIRNYPPVNNTLELAQNAVIVLEDDGLAFVCSNTLNFSGELLIYKIHNILCLIKMFTLMLSLQLLDSVTTILQILV